MNAATISTRNRRPIPTTPPTNFCPYSKTRRLSPSVDLSRVASHCLIERSHLPPPAASTASDCGWRDQVLAVLERADLEAERVAD